MIKAGIVGGTGYTGAELLRLLVQHPQVELRAITSRKEAGTPIAAMFPSLRRRVDLAFTEPDGSLEARLHANRRGRQLITSIPTDARLRFSTMFREGLHPQDARGALPDGDPVTIKGEPLSSFDALWYIDAARAQLHASGASCAD